MNNELNKILDTSSSLEELNRQFSLPEPYDDAGFYMVYYCKADYRFVLPDIIDYIESGMRIYYDRHLESGESHTQDFCRRAVSSHCRCIVFYLSENVFSDPTFNALIRLVGEKNIPCISINRSSDGKIVAGTDMAVGQGLDEDVLAYVNTLFAREVTFIPFTLPIDEKKHELSQAYEKHTMHFTVAGDFAVAEYVKDLSENEVIIPPSIEVNGVEYPVRAVSARAFSDCRDLERIVFPDTVEDIGYGCNSESLGEVFENCESLTEIIYPKNVKKLYGGMFHGCTNLKRLILNDTLEFAGDVDNHFDFDAKRGADIEIKSNTNDFDDEEIHINPHSFERLHLPLSAKKFLEDDEYVRFSYNSDGNFFTSFLQVKELTGGSVIMIDKAHQITTAAELFSIGNNPDVEEITFHPEFTYGQKWIKMFYECAKLKRIVLPNTITELDQAFYKCESLEEIILPSSLVEIGPNCFYKCTSLRDIHLPRHVCFVSDSAFLGCHLNSITCDSKFSYNIFKSGYRTPTVVYTVSNPFTRGLLKILLRLFATTKEEKTTKGFHWWATIDHIYINNNVKEFDIDGYIKAKSDKEGYRRYDCNISFIDRLHFKGQQVEYMNRKR